MAVYVEGQKLSLFGEAIREDGETFSIQYSQACIGYTIDEFVSYFNLDVPNYIKIDVDGNEGDILDGMKESLLNLNLN